MHEIGLIDDIICIINARLKESKENSKVKKVNVVIGELEHVSLRHFEFHFREATRGTLLENVELNFKKVKARFKCGDCNYEYLAEDGNNGCPRCSSLVNNIISGKGVFVESIEVA
jgi:hydrogenase nickel incorporation protein HypA/HybF